MWYHPTMRQKEQFGDFNTVVVGAGPAGMAAAIAAAGDGASVLLLEKMPQPAIKLKATGGGRCNLASNLSNDEIIKRFGREGRFMIPALRGLDCSRLLAFFESIGVNCHIPDGMRVFPTSHNSDTVVKALLQELERQKITLRCSQKVTELLVDNSRIIGLTSNDEKISCRKLILATGGKASPAMGSSGEGLAMAAAVGHTITDLFPAMLPLQTKETWVKNCRADTVGKAEIKINMPGEKKLQAKGDLIFTANGIRGPVVLDFAREITPLLQKYGEVAILVNLTRGLNEEELRARIAGESAARPAAAARETLAPLVSLPLADQLCLLAGIEPQKPLKQQSAAARDQLLKLLAWTPLTVIGHEGWKAAMVTRGGISLKEIHPETLESRLIKGLYFCGEIVNLDGPCGGFNLHWCFASGILAGTSSCRCSEKAC